MVDDKAAARTPTGLGSAGRRLWRETTGRYELRPDELVLLEQACRTADDAAGLVELLAGTPDTVAGSVGQPVLHPARRELRETRLLLARLLGQLDLPDAGGGQGWDHLSASARARKAARVRWDRGA